MSSQERTNGIRDGTGPAIVPRIDTTCPRCHHETQVFRSTGPLVEGGLRLDEFQVLVRNEWRRRLGPDAYGRAHSDQIARLLVLLASNPDSAALRERLKDQVWLAVADIHATGGGRQEVRREMAKLLQAIRAVLKEAGVDVEKACRTYLEPGRRAIEGVLDYPALTLHRTPAEDDDGRAA